MKKKQYYNIVKAILPQLSGYESNWGELVFVSPISHTLRGFCFSGSGTKEDFYLHWFFQPLCDQKDHVVLSYGQRLMAPNGTQVWSVDTPDLPGQILRAFRKRIPYLDQLRSEHDVVRAIKQIYSGDEGLFEHRYSAFLLILSGDYPAAEREFRRLFAREADATRDWEAQLIETARSIHKLLLRNPDEALEQIKAWRLESIQKLGLEKWATD